LQYIFEDYDIIDKKEIAEDLYNFLISYKQTDLPIENFLNNEKYLLSLL